MLTASQISALRDRSEQLLDPITDFLIQDIAERVKEAGQFTGTASYNAWRLQQLGVSQKQLKKEIAKRLKVSQKEAEQLLTQAAETGYNFDMSRFPTSKAIPLSANSSIQQILDATVKQARDDLTNITQTIGFVGNDGVCRELTGAYNQACDFAFQKVSLGAQDFNSAVREATANLAKKGIRYIDYESGVHTSLEAAVRRNIMGGLGIMQNQISRQNHDYLGCDGWEISAHSGSAPDHEPYQGKQYPDKEFQRLNSSLVRPIGELNCGHAASPIIMGVNDPQYTPEELEAMRQENEEGVTFEGKHYTLYEASQRQRKFERSIRDQKRKILIDETLGDTDKLQHDQIRLQVLKQNYARFSKGVGLPMQHARMGAAGFDWKKGKAAKKVLEYPKKAAKKEIQQFREINDAIDFAYGGYNDSDFTQWKSAYKKQNSGVRLSDEELKSINDYTEGGFVALNDVSRFSDAELIKKGYSPSDIARIRKKADTLSGALSKYTLDTDIVTHRFERDVSWLTGNGNGIEDLEKLVGEEYTTEGFTSSGMLPNRFRFTGGKSDAVHFEIVTPKGTNGAFLSMSEKGENEFLYNRNTRYRVIDGGERTVKEQKFNIKTMQMEEIEVRERFLKVQVIPDEMVSSTAKKMLDKSLQRDKIFTPAKTIEEARSYAKQVLGLDTDLLYNKVNIDVANAINKCIREVYDTFGDVHEAGFLNGLRVMTGNKPFVAAYSPALKEILLLQKNVSFKSSMSTLAKTAKKQFDMGFWSTGEAEHSIRHEIGHSVNMWLADTDGSKLKRISALRERITRDCGITSWSTSDTDEHIKSAGGFLSYYALRNDDEFVAEAIAEYMGGNPRETAKEVVEILLGRK